MIAFPFAIFCLALLALCAALLCAAAVRYSRTPPDHPDRGARRDTVRLLALVSVSLGLAAARTQFLSTSLPFLALSVTLVLLGIAAIGLAVRLAGAYRHDRNRPPDPGLPDVKTLRSRFSSPPEERKR